MSRHETEILRLVQAKSSCSIKELAHNLHVSDETIRRHIKPLVLRGLVEKVHGGVVLPHRMQEPPFERRLQENRSAKQHIADAVAELIQDGDSIIIDAGSTTAYIAMALRRHSRLSVITNSTDITRILSSQRNNKIYLAGGEIHANTAATAGPSTLDFLRQFHVHHAILSIGAINPQGDFLDYRLHEAEFSKVAIERADIVTVAADLSKFNNKGLVKVCDLEQTNYFVTDNEPPAAFLKALTQTEASLIVAPSSSEM